MMPRSYTHIDGIRPLDAPEARQAIAPLHAYLRECILDGTLTPGTKLSQVGLAQQLGVSRTPVREVLRMLQEEGLVDIEPNQRTRVAGLDPGELDHIYASRILMETLALSMTLHRFGASERREGKRLLTALRRTAREGDIQSWFAYHADFHRLITSAAEGTLRHQLTTLADRTIRYIRIYQLSEPATWQNAGDVEHARILRALTDEDGPRALSELAHHLSRTALRVLHDCKPSYVPVVVPHAVDLVTRAAARDAELPTTA